MTTRSSLLLMASLWLLLLACNPKEALTPKESLPVDTWSVGASQLSPDPDGFRLIGVCCA